jgi:hypothetical protein
MKKLLLICCAALMLSCKATAQTSASDEGNKKFIAVMETSLAQLDTASAPATFMTLANTFDRIANAEKVKWQPFYYAAYCYAVMAVSVPDKTKIDMLADQAELYLTQASTLKPGDSEISTLFAMIKSSRILVDPVSRWQTLGAEETQHLNNAKQQDANNPRPYLIEARIKYKTPEALGGGKEVAKQILAEGIEKFKVFKPVDSISPNWGSQSAIKFLDSL